MPFRGTIRLRVRGDEIWRLRSPRRQEASSGVPFEFERFDDFDEAIQKVRDGDLPGAILARGTEIELRFAASDQTAAATIRGITSGVVDSLNVMASGQPPTFKLSSQQVEDSSPKPIQFIGPA